MGIRMDSWDSLRCKANATSYIWVGLVMSVITVGHHKRVDAQLYLQPHKLGSLFSHGFPCPAFRLVLVFSTDHTIIRY